MQLTSARPSYDQFNYIGRSHLQTHPDRLSALGRLYGMQPAPVERCRVLELACCDGANLIPMAYALPESTFLGVDLAAVPLAAGVQHAARFSLGNLRLEVCDILDFPADAGEFDYIIAHGIYSWCPPAVRDRLLAVCAAHLAPQGIAFVSFNSYPGYHDRELQRQLMLFHLANFPAATPGEEASRALEALSFVAAAQHEKNEYRFMLEQAHKSFSESIARGPSGLAWFQHDLLSGWNEPVYFHQFMDHAGSHGLQFVSEAFLREPRFMHFPPDTRQAFQAMNLDIIQREQYVDFLLNTAFRQPLLCRRDVKLDRSPSPATMQDLYVAGTIRSVPPAEGADPEAAETFIGPAGKVGVKQRESKEVLRTVSAAWPGSVSFAELLARTEGGAARALADFLLLVCGAKLVNFRVRPSPALPRLSEKPLASAVAREQVLTAQSVTNLLHEMITLDLPEQHLLQLLDGTRDRAGLLAAMREWVVSGEAAEAHRRLLGTNPELAKFQTASPISLDTLEADLDTGLRAMVNSSLLVA